MACFVTALHIPHETFAYERQRVRAYLADRNVFGVDLNPIAVELGQVSLWLNCLHAGGFAPWFEDQVHTGNSLVGARRAAFPVSCLTAKREEDRWYKTKPREIGWSGAKRASDEVWHFLLPDPGMCAYDVNIVRPLAPDDWKTITEWQREFTGPLNKDEVATVRRLSQAVDVLFDEVADKLQEMRREVNDDISIWPAAMDAEERHIDFSEKIRRLATFHGDGARTSVAWRRLKAAMDAWCALWFWPIDKASLLPSRTKFLQDLDLVLTQGITGQTIKMESFSTSPSQGRLFENVPIPAKKGTDTLSEGEKRVVEVRRESLFDDLDVNRLIQASPWLPIAMEVASQRFFMHFDLEFADIMRERGEFDLVIGNPPWLKPIWSDPIVLAEHHPEIALRKYSSARVDKEKTAIFAANADLSKSYLQAYLPIGGFQSFTSSGTNFPFVDGGSPNIYHCFIDLSFRISSKKGICALIHQDSHFKDPSLITLRKACFARLTKHFHFRNVMTNRMFSDVNSSEMFSSNIYRAVEHGPNFDHISGLFVCETIDECYEHDDIGPVPGTRTASSWEVRGHHKRCVPVTDDELRLMGSLTTESEGSNGRFLYCHSTETLAVLRSLSSVAKVGNKLNGLAHFSSMWHEVESTKNKKLLRLQGAHVDAIDDLIIKGPCIFVGNPLYKCPSHNGTQKEDFDSIDLLQIDEGYIPRTNFVRLVSKSSLYMQSATVPWSTRLRHCDHYRIAMRGMVQPARERTLAAALVPPGLHHSNSICSFSFESEIDLIDVYPLYISITHDFLIKTMQITNMTEAVLRSLPYVSLPAVAKRRALRLACLTRSYAPIWNAHGAAMAPSEWASSNPCLKVEWPDSDLEDWTPGVGLRSDFGRRQALLEIDVIVAKALGLTLDQLIELYRTQFQVLDDNERGTWYDQNGRIVWTCSKGLSDRGWRQKDANRPTEHDWLNKFADLPAGAQLENEATQHFISNRSSKATTLYLAPFFTCNREADYREAWAFFAAQFDEEVS